MGAHALLSPSGASRWMACTPSAQLEQQFPDKSGDAAREGTMAHAIAEIMLLVAIGKISNYEYQKQYADIRHEDMLNGRRIYKEQNPDAPHDVMIAETKDTGEFYCHAMHEYCEQYVTFVLEKFAESKAVTPSARLYVEERLDISNWAPESFGTGDAGIVANIILKIIDLKYGKGVEVSAIENTQMKIYALGWLTEFAPVYDIEVVEMTIFQPRIDNYSTWTISVVDLLKWAEEELQPKALLAFEGKGDFVAGKHCQFCRCKTTCRALADYNNELAKYDFADPVFLEDFELVEIASRIAIYKNWIGAIEEYMLEEAVKRGKKWPGLKLVAGRSNRVLTNEKKVIKILQDRAYEDDEYYNISLKGIGDLEKLVGGKKAFDRLFDQLIIKPKGKPTLVPESDVRTELNSAAEAAKDFDDDYLIEH